MTEFKPINTQEEFDRAISERITRLNAKHSEASAEFQTRIEALEAENSSLRDAGKENAEKIANFDKLIAEKDEEIKKYESASVTAKIENLKVRIAHEKGIPYELASRLTGETEEDIRNDADTFSKSLPKAKPIPLADPEGAPKEDYFKKKYGKSPYYKNK